MKRQHKIAILKYTTKNFWLLVIPLVRGLIAVGFDVYNWVRGAYLDIIVIALIILLAVVRWYFVTYEIRETCIRVQSGMLLKSNFEVPYKAISSVSAKRLLWLRPTKAVSIAIDSDSHSVYNKPGKADIELTVSFKDYTELFNKIPTESTNAKITYHASKWNLMLFSFVFSSTLSGVILIGTVLIQGGKIIGGELNERFISAVNGMTEVMQKIVNGLTPAAAALTVVMFFGWLLSFISNLLRHINFRIQRCGENIFVENGFFSKWKYYINISRVNCADLRQNLLMKICRVMSVHVSCTGYGKSKNEIPVFVPVTTRKRVISSMRMTLPNFTISNISIRPRKLSMMTYIWLPLLLATVIPVSGAVILHIFPSWSGTIEFLTLMAEIPAAYMLIVKIAAKFTSGIGADGDTITLKYCKMFHFHTIIVPKNRIVYMRISRTIFQQMGKSCDIWVYTKGERAARHRVRGVDIEAAEAFCREI